MRKFLILGAALLPASTVLAQPAGYDEEPVYEAHSGDAGWLEDDEESYEPAYAGEPAPILHPGQVEAMAGVMDRLVGAVMDLPIGGIAAAVDPLGRGGYHPGATVRDMATRGDPYAEARIRGGIRGATRSVGAMSNALRRVMPELERTMDQVSREVEAAMEEVDRGPR